MLKYNLNLDLFPEEFTISDEMKEEVYNYVIDRFEELKTKRDRYDDRVYEWLRLYNSIPKDTRDGRAIEAWEHNIFVPYIFATVETIKPRIKASIFNDPFYLDVQSLDKGFVGSERKVRDWMITKLDNMGFEDTISGKIGDALQTPAGWTKVVVEKDAEGHNDVNLYGVDFHDIWIDFSKQRKLKEVFHRIESNLNKLRALEKKGIYENIDDVEGTEYDVDIIQKKSEIESLFMSMGDTGVDKKKEEANAVKRRKVELLEWWGSYDVNGDGYDENILVTIANRTIGIRIDVYEDELPFFPIRIGKNNVTNYGRPIAQQLEMLQEELNDKRSKRMDLLDRLLKLMFKARRTSTMDWDTLFSAPDNVLLMDDIHNDLDVIRQDPLPASSYKEEDITKGDMQYTSGANDYNNLGRSGAKGTATGISAILTEAATRFRSHVDDVVSDIVPIIKYIFFKLKKYVKTKENVRILNSKEWEQLSPGDFEGNYKLKIGISNVTTPNKELRIQLLINLLNVVGRLEGMVNVKEFVKRILAQADIKNIDSIMEEDAPSVSRKDTLAKRELIAKRKGTELIDKPVEEIISGNGMLPPPVAPEVPQVASDPFLDLVNTMRSGGALDAGQ